MKIAVLMDSIDKINIKKDSTFAMLLEAQVRGYDIHYMTQSDIYMMNHSPYADTKIIQVTDTPQNYFKFLSSQTILISELDVILMRKDPPFDMEYIMDTYILDMAQNQGVLIVNNPQALRDANEKFFTEAFPQFSPQCVISRNPAIISQFARTRTQVIIKPMDGMGGASIFKTGKNDPNLNVIIETVTNNGTRTTMAQEYIPEIDKGDKRILLINGKPVPYALARIPSTTDFRGNLAKGGTGVGQPLTKDDYEICAVVGPKLQQMGIIFAGIDVIGRYLTEVNVTSPTCIRELDELYGLNIAAQMFTEIEKIKSAA
ncbi:Glutathione synthetase [hydrothermal vent metagenome]|uniref:Glutathione synthetase n=1 Tax=hydrothermal vent metagenome TaxID=652676 RepID=A0A3B0VLW8_9ZZZZ